MLGNCSSEVAIESSSDEEHEKIKTYSECQKKGVYVKQHSMPSPCCEQSDNIQKRNTIHIENPSEKTPSAKRINLIDDTEIRSRTQSVNGRMVSEANCQVCLKFI